MAFGKRTTINSVAKGQEKEVVFPKGPEDTVSALRWSPVSNHLAAACWDGKVYIYDAANPTSTDTIKGVAAINIGTPVLDCDFSKDGAIAVGAAADKKIHLMDLNSSQTMKLEGHTSPVRTVRFVDVPSANCPIIASGSWDKTVRYWDMRQPQPIGALELPERVYAMDANGPTLTIATADNQHHFVNLHANPLQLWRSTKSPLEYQTTSLSACPGGTLYAAVGIGGRCAVQVTDPEDKSFKDLKFKCHREPIVNKNNFVDVYAVNDVAFSPTDKEVLVTAGSDGTCCIWDLKKHTRLWGSPKATGPLTSICFARDGMGLAYAVGYDWAKGYQHNKPGTETKLVLLRFPKPPKEIFPKKDNVW